jgi:hypothetical protein
MRLIDADELMEHVWRDKLDSRELIAGMVAKAPTIKEISTKIPIDVFEKLISQEPRWISVSERLPEDFQRVLVTIVNYNGDKVVRVAEYSRRTFKIKENYEQWNVGEKGLLAWRPLPEPYKAESER